MYKVSLNSRITKQGLTQANRSLSTNVHPRQGGMSKLLIGGVVASAASYAYYQRYQKDNDFYHGDSDPYSKTKHSKSNDALQELNYAGDHIKRSAEDVADVARDTFSTVKKETKETMQHLKSESKTDANQAAFNAAHKLDHNPMVKEKLSSNKTKSNYETKLEDHAQRNVHDTTPLVSKDTDKVKPVWNDKPNVEKEIKTALEDTKDSVLDTTATLGKEIKSSVFGIFGNTAPETYTREELKRSGRRESWETRLGAENVISTRTDQDIINATRTPGKKGTSYDFYGIAETEGNPMVSEKLNTEKTKPLWETSLEEHAQEVVHDTSTLVDKDTQKVKQGVWDAKNLANEKTSGSISHKETPSFWSSWFGGGKSETQRLEQEAKETWGDLKNKAEVTKDDVKQTASQSWLDAKHKAEAEAGRVKSDVDSTIQDLSNKSKQETNRLSSGWNNLKKEVKDDADYVLHKAEDTASSISGKFKNESNRLETDAERAARDVKNEGSRLTRHASNEVSHKAEEVKDEGARLARRASDSIYSKAEDVKDKAEGVKDEGARLARRASDSIYSKAEEAKNEAARKAEEVKDESARLARRASGSIFSKAEEAKNEVAHKAEDVKDESARFARRASDSIYSKAEDVKDKAEDTAKSWYRAGTDQVKSGINNVKNAADEDIHWAEEKVHGGVEGIKETFTEAKEEVSRLFGERRDQGYKDHVVRGEKYAEDEAGQLRATRDNVGLKPAEVVVEEAHSYDM